MTINSHFSTPSDGDRPREEQLSSSHGSANGLESDQRVALSIIVPVHNDPENLRICLEALSAASREFDEIIVIDDASDDDTADVARTFDVRLLEQETRLGPARARNRGAEAAGNPFLFFVDADVRVKPDTLERVAGHFLSDPSMVAFFGSYDDRPGAPNVVSQFRNLLHHHVHQTGSEDASTFWSGCGAIRQETFLDIGGFDASYAAASIEDIELGARLRRAGHQIQLVKSIQVTHMKRWTLWRMVECDVRKRGIPWTRLVLQQGKIPNDLNLRLSQRLSALFAGGVLASCALAPWLAGTATLWWLPALGFLAGIVLLNRSFYALLLRRKSLSLALAGLPLHVLYYLCAGLAFAIGGMAHLARRLRPLQASES